MKTTLYINIYRKENELGAVRYDTSDYYLTREEADYEAKQPVKGWEFVKTIEVELND